MNVWLDIINDEVVVPNFKNGIFIKVSRIEITLKEKSVKQFIRDEETVENVKMKVPPKPIKPIESPKIEKLLKFDDINEFATEAAPPSKSYHT
jgi:hypothetical protein